MKLYKKKIIEREDGKPYLIRYTLFTCRWFSIKVHNILISDYDCMHDHPWAFITFLVKGGYVEHRQVRHVFTLNDGEAYTLGPVISKVQSRWSLLFRPAKSIHRLEIHQPVWSIVVTFKKERQWGFFTKAGWLPWFKYNSQNSCENNGTRLYLYRPFLRVWWHEYGSGAG